jgi:hypothetical protein
MEADPIKLERTQNLKYRGNFNSDFICKISSTEDVLNHSATIIVPHLAALRRGQPWWKSNMGKEIISTECIT